ncbi:MAG TPA: ABC transporter permease [Vicinamibacteria bacterium]|nr:ABC transporter permease [Vicinamibacteria bacterium]
MESMVLTNLIARPVRTLASVVGVALAVVLILVTVGLARGMLSSSGEREANLRAEILFLPPGGLGAGLTTMPLTLPIAYARAIGEVEGVAKTTPVARYVRSGARGIGFELIEGVRFIGDGELAAYPEVTGLAIVQGRLPETRDEIVVDPQRARDPDAALGSTMELLGREFRVVGVYRPEMGARIKMPLEGMQELLGADERCSWILIRTESGAAPEDVARRIEARFPGNQIVFTRDIPGMWAQGMPSLDVFLNVVIALSVFISGLTVFLSLYTAITERTREIGILKSMGGSKAFIVALIESEVLMVAGLGILLGIGIALGMGWAITAGTSLVVRLDWEWTLAASVLALAGGALGALYPALKAAHQDPVEALSYE